MPAKTVLVEIEHWVATLTLDRASLGNAVNERMAFELRDACDQVAQDDGVWVVVVTGRGEAFCRGIDPSAMKDPGQDGTPVEQIPSLKVAGRIAAIEKPVIAALNGDAIDQGLELALACDIRIASSQARFGLTQVKDGLMPWDGGTQRLPRLVSRGRGMEMILTCRIVDAQEALEIGLLHQVAEPGQVLRQASEMARTIAGHGPIAARYLKEAVSKGLDMTLEQGLRLEADLNLILQSTSDRGEGIRSFLEGRTPKYTGE